MAKQSRRKAQQRNRNNNLWLGGLLALGVLVLSIAWIRSQPTVSTAGYPGEITVAEAVAKRAAGAFILDVRQPDEWNEFHIPGSTLIPLGELDARLSDVPRDQEVVVVCRSGNRSAQARDILLAAGFTQVTSMAGGLTEWRAAGHPTVSGP